MKTNQYFCFFIKTISGILIVWLITVIVFITFTDSIALYRQRLLPEEDEPLDVFNCGIPDCRSELGRKFLWPHNEYGKFYECSKATHRKFTKSCPQETYFSFYEQGCIHKRDYIKSLLHCDK